MIGSEALQKTPPQHGGTFWEGVHGGEERVHRPADITVTLHATGEATEHAHTVALID